MAWIYLLVAGALEVTWASGLKKLGLAFSWPLAIFSTIAMFASLLALYASMTKLPLGVAYPIWTGIGSVGSVLVSVMLFNQSISFSTIAGIALLIAGMVLIGADAH